MDEPDTPSCHSSAPPRSMLLTTSQGVFAFILLFSLSFLWKEKKSKISCLPHHRSNFPYGSWYFLFCLGLLVCLFNCLLWWLQGLGTHTPVSYIFWSILLLYPLMFLCHATDSVEAAASMNTDEIISRLIEEAIKTDTLSTIESVQSGDHAAGRWVVQISPKKKNGFSNKFYLPGELLDK